MACSMTSEVPDKDHGCCACIKPIVVYSHPTAASHDKRHAPIAERRYVAWPLRTLHCMVGPTLMHTHLAASRSAPFQSRAVTTKLPAATPRSTSARRPHSGWQSHQHHHLRRATCTPLSSTRRTAPPARLCRSAVASRMPAPPATRTPIDHAPDAPNRRRHRCPGGARTALNVPATAEQLAMVEPLTVHSTTAPAPGT